MPKVSVCIPIYNVEQYIGRCIESVISQSLKEIEIIIVNDCTPDNSIEIVRQYAVADNRIKIIEHDINHGLMMARRTGYMAAVGEYITFLDSDDTLAEGALETLYVTANKEKADIVSGTIQYVPNNGERYIWNNELKYGTDRVSVFKSLLKREFGHNLCSKLFKKELLQNYNYQTFDNFINAEDAALFYQVLQYANKVIHKNTVVYCYYQNSQSSTHVRLKEHALYSIIQLNKIRLNTCGKIDSLKNNTWVYVSEVLNGLIAQGYNKNGLLKKLIERENLQDFVNPIIMFTHYPLSSFIKTMVKRVIYPNCKK